MKDSDLLPISTPATSKLFGKGRYKLYALIAILLLACWSMLTGTVTLKSSAATDTDAAIRSDLDVLEVEEREKVVRKMWEVYSHNRQIQLPRFWREAFEAAYEELADEDSKIREDTISEIARMSMQRLLDLESYPRNPKSTAYMKNHLLHGKAKIRVSSSSP
ncbi:uncharacterized protein A4U43_C03F6770 [Asparagus officinalis]|uniref:Uncharacterized protein n=1 Tax=Asparagus officinalis TaxID=4686 RepID=A0A5P1F7Y5_ASPOF|nr:uncharacterized protein LOC109833114 [Asparagus officinalis]ONK74486.1 uncharacterized protein A4U43_C03F6770 [Asparagus officinalis]